MDGVPFVPLILRGQLSLTELARYVAHTHAPSAEIDIDVAFALGEGTMAEREAYTSMGGAKAFAFLDGRGRPAKTSAFLRSIAAPADWVRQAQRKSWALQLAAPRSRDFDAAEDTIPSGYWLSCLSQESPYSPVTAQIRRHGAKVLSLISVEASTKPLAVLVAALQAHAELNR